MGGSEICFGLRGKKLTTRKEQEWLREEEVGMRMENSRESHWDSSLHWSALRQRIQMSKPYAWQVTCKLLAETKKKKKGNKRQESESELKIKQTSVCLLFFCTSARTDKLFTSIWLCTAPTLWLQLSIETRQLMTVHLWKTAGTCSLFCKVLITLEEALWLCIQPCTVINGCTESGLNFTESYVCVTEFMNDHTKQWAMPSWCNLWLCGWSMLCHLLCLHVT